jgi:hypothetical protein
MPKLFQITRPAPLDVPMPRWCLTVPSFRDWTNNTARYLWCLRFCLASQSKSVCPSYCFASHPFTYAIATCLTDFANPFFYETAMPILKHFELQRQASPLTPEHSPCFPPACTHRPANSGNPFQVGINVFIRTPPALPFFIQQLNPSTPLRSAALSGPSISNLPIILSKNPKPMFGMTHVVLNAWKPSTPNLSVPSIRQNYVSQDYTSLGSLLRNYTLRSVLKMICCSSNPRSHLTPT